MVSDERIQRLTSICGELVLRSFRYDGAVLALRMETFEDNRLLAVTARTGWLETGPGLVGGASPFFQIRILDALPTVPRNEHGYYVAPSEFAELMRLKRSGLAGFYGRKTAVRHAFSLWGSGGCQVSCIVETLDDIDWSLSDFPE